MSESLYKFCLLIWSKNHSWDLCMYKGHGDIKKNTLDNTLYRPLMNLLVLMPSDVCDGQSSQSYLFSIKKKERNVYTL